MGVIISRYMDPSCNEGAIVKFIIDSIRLVKTVCTSDTYFTDLTPWNVINFNDDDPSTTEPLLRGLPWYNWNEASYMTDGVQLDMEHGEQDWYEGVQDAEVQRLYYEMRSSGKLVDEEGDGVESAEDHTRHDLLYLCRGYEEVNGSV
ncbi:hypothetical protein BWQ96_08141 [Gracilariopsis chorda]|uniref:Uncharacterized protein n=1 Tax=Gracilariopsis chorda TaxID=448386 RepID=A0A2V3IJ72_9FLOR|nr:hypothetical protein BWQ96_08141 [Gracilariopsis chorda]|eukprot:PXF42109.1 hypothetical protein BWQ96_08141 [Gracilariopsis chorda]